jgi:hypothetical protein
MVIHVRTLGSHWYIDAHGGKPRYMRMPLFEGPREEPYKEMSEGTVLEDFKWHPMVTWAIRDGQLRICYRDPEDNETYWIRAPGAEVVDKYKEPRSQ